MKGKTSEDERYFTGKTEDKYTINEYSSGKQCKQLDQMSQLMLNDSEDMLSTYIFFEASYKIQSKSIIIKSIMN